MKMNGLNKLGSHSTGHHNQSDGLVGSEWPWLCQKDGQLTRGKGPVKEKRQYNGNGRCECRGKDSVVRDMPQNDGCDVGQRIDSDSSPPRHEFRSNSKSTD